MTENLNNISKTLSGWGRNSKAVVKILNPKDKEELKDIILNSKKIHLLQEVLEDLMVMLPN